MVWIFNLFIPNGSGLNDYITIQDNGENTFRSMHWLDEHTQTQTVIKIKIIKIPVYSSFQIILTFETSAPHPNHHSQWSLAIKPKQTELRLQKRMKWSELYYICLRKMSSMSLWLRINQEICYDNWLSLVFEGFHEKISFRWCSYCSMANQIMSSPGQNLAEWHHVFTQFCETFCQAQC